VGESPEPDEVRRVLAEAERLHDQPAVEAALDAMAEAVRADFEDTNPVLLGVMVGGVVPLAGLLNRLRFPLQVDYLHATRYRGDVRGGDLHWMARPQIPLSGRDVLVVDDILDEGITLARILAACRGMGARRVRSAVLVHKRHDRKPELARADYTGLEVEDRYVFGYGMDYRGYLRNADGIYAVRGL
jgi:hypoxanthine phosphoribosyltransferase